MLRDIARTEHFEWHGMAWHWFRYDIGWLGLKSNGNDQNGHTEMANVQRMTNNKTYKTCIRT